MASIIDLEKRELRGRVREALPSLIIVKPVGENTDESGKDIVIPLPVEIVVSPARAAAEVEVGTKVRVSFDVLDGWFIDTITVNGETYTAVKGEASAENPGYTNYYIELTLTGEITTVEIATTKEEPAPSTAIDVTLNLTDADNKAPVDETAKSAEPGESVTFTVTVEEGYELKDLSGNATMVPENGQGEVTITVAIPEDATEAIEVTATVAPAGEEPGPSVDPDLPKATKSQDAFAGSTITVPYYGETEPDAAWILEKVKTDLKLTGDYTLSTDKTKLTDTATGDQATISLERYVKVFVGETLLGYVKATDGSGHANLTAVDANASYLLKANVAKATSADATTGADGKFTAALGAQTADVVLVRAYNVKKNPAAITAVVSYRPEGAIQDTTVTLDASNNTYVQEGAIVLVQVDDGATADKLYHSVTVTDEKSVTGLEEWFAGTNNEKHNGSYIVAAEDANEATGIITITYNTGAKVTVDGTPVEGVYAANAGVELPAGYAVDQVFLTVQDDGEGTVTLSTGDTIKAAWVGMGPEAKLQITLPAATSADNGVYTLVSAYAISNKAAGDTTVTYKYGSMDDAADLTLSGTTASYLPKDAEVTFTTKTAVSAVVVETETAGTYALPEGSRYDKYNKGTYTTTLAGDMKVTELPVIYSGTVKVLTTKNTEINSTLTDTWSVTFGDGSNTNGTWTWTVTKDGEAITKFATDGGEGVVITATGVKIDGQKAIMGLESGAILAKDVATTGDLQSDIVLTIAEDGTLTITMTIKGATT